MGRYIQSIFLDLFFLKNPLFSYPPQNSVWNSSHILKDLYLGLLSQIIFEFNCEKNWIKVPDVSFLLLKKISQFNWLSVFDQSVGCSAAFCKKWLVCEPRRNLLRYFNQLICLVASISCIYNYILLHMLYLRCWQVNSVHLPQQFW